MGFLKNIMNTIKINQTIVSSGSRNIIITGDRVIIDGVDFTPDSKQITIEVIGDIDSISSTYSKEFNVTGSVGKLESTSGDLNIQGGVTGNVKTTSGDIVCENVGGDVSTISGDVKGKIMTKNIKTVSGDIVNLK